MQLLLLSKEIWDIHLILLPIYLIKHSGDAKNNPISSFNNHIFICRYDGDDTLNLKLSEQRANAVKELLVSLGVDEASLTAKGYGETKPVDPNTTTEGKANNRRVEFVKK